VPVGFQQAINAAAFLPQPPKIIVTVKNIL
jgi:hypothetical protein